MKSWRTPEVHKQAVELLGGTVATALEREAHYRGCEVSLVGIWPGYPYAIIWGPDNIDGITLYYQNGAWR